jgi:hypothetical protein
MGKYLDILSSEVATKATKATKGIPPVVEPQRFADFGRLNRFCRTLSALEARCPEIVPVARWQAAVEDGCRFVAQWGEQAEAMGWTARDLFGLFPVPVNPHPSFSRLSRYDHTGLIWLLQGCPVIALTEATAAIQNQSGAITIYRKHNKPGLGPTGDSLDDFSR